MKGINILLVEDNEAHIELIVRGLRKGNQAQQIHVVRDGQEAVDYLFNKGRYGDKERFPPPGLVILDLKLHKMDGIEVLKRVRRGRGMRKVPVVIFSSSGYTRDIEASYRNGADKYIVKPIDPGEFQQRLRDIQSYLTENNTIPGDD
ncbi:MAG: response regulator [Syntrophobacterales bacterium]|nr:MAG: response regulator [Syntrophobacterales bacterium]